MTWYNIGCVVRPTVALGGDGGGARDADHPRRASDAHLQRSARERDFKSGKRVCDHAKEAASNVLSPGEAVQDDPG